jgi:hypothetical protein
VHALATDGGFELRFRGPRRRAWDRRQAAAATGRCRRPLRHASERRTRRGGDGFVIRRAPG